MLQSFDNWPNPSLRRSRSRSRSCSTRLEKGLEARNYLSAFHIISKVLERCWLIDSALQDVREDRLRAHKGQPARSCFTLCTKTRKHAERYAETTHLLRNTTSVRAKAN